MSSSVRSRILYLEEATIMLPLVRRITEDIKATWCSILEKRELLEVIGEALSHPLVEKSSTHRSLLTDQLSDIKEKLNILIDKINKYVYEMEELGCFVEEFKRGVINFPSLYMGRKVFLCWTLNDGDEILFWHEIDESYAERSVIRDRRDFLVRRLEE